ncbi:efflux RND transporter periplasmic adaptor subunit [Tropicimonas sediminicola]|uniref:RND family efflux transporter, MFP subunit n=1 Tax=Tropicimonas sediminicola TaxID=1031541 RepID=A0A239FN89_9RHOB|nr:efflux RND transporter periplasmic adaptor subunit [Tropicimonas sediminicola]SNS57404.1 RND family efflux transporter, MFP subunit [Tropicimonas sediminicola]
MKRILSLLLGVAIVAAAWIYTFGLPVETDAERVAGAGSQQAAGARSGGGGPRGGGGPTVVTLADVEVSPFVDTFRSVGTAKAKANVRVESEVSGQVRQVHFGANEEVAAGDPLISLDDRVEQIALRSAMASLSEARSTLERYTTLRQANSGVVSAVAETEASTQLEIAEANLARAEYDLEQKTIRAPISGMLGLTDVEPGAFLGAGTSIVTITDQSVLTIEFGLPDRAAGIVEVGQTVRLTTGSLPGRVFQGVIEGFDRQIDSTTRTIKVRARVENPDGYMLPGMIFNVILDTQNEPLPSVSANAITWGRDGASVWVVENGVARSQSVAIRHRSEDRVWLDAELVAGQQIVVEGVQKMREGAEVGTAADMAAPRREAPTGSAGEAGAGAASAAESPRPARVASAEAAPGASAEGSAN